MMLTTFSRVMDEYRRKVRLEAALCARESDRRDQAEVFTWVRYRGDEMITPGCHCMKEHHGKWHEPGCPLWKRRIK